VDGSTIKASGCLKALIYVADILELALKDGEHIDRNEYQSFAEWVSSTCMQGKYGMIIYIFMSVYWLPM
jgi:hypothetical protein